MDPVVDVVASEVDTPTTNDQIEVSTVDTPSAALDETVGTQTESTGNQPTITQPDKPADVPVPAFGPQADSAPVAAAFGKDTENSIGAVEAVGPVTQPVASGGFDAAAVIAGAASSPGVGDGGARRKKLLLFGAAGAAVVLLAGGVVFGSYLPNRPESVWKNSLGRSGKALSALVDKAADKKTIETFQNSKMSLAADLKYGETTGALRWDGTSDSMNTNGTMTISVDGGGTDAGGKLEYLTRLTETEQLPNLYFKGQ
ncbi:hypothetical protein IPL68_01465 [Candidatus Saccharibacteria bacterium]|nr:MAG: hypothetical protein IPL68_01465 [Candidatus Saccharibacteria bacterium]